MTTRTAFRHIIWLFCLLLLSSCSMKLPDAGSRRNVKAYGVEGEYLLARHAPVFLIESPEEEHNRPGTVVAVKGAEKTVTAAVSPEKATFYAEVRKWQGINGPYVNLVYRLNFSESPLDLVPFNIGYGNNVGLFVIVTLNQQHKPVLYTTVHTCGCYLAFLPTEELPRSSFPVEWHEKRQEVYGESLPALLPRIEDDENVYITLRETTHRVADAYRHSRKKLYNFPYEIANLRPLADLQNIEAGNGEVVSFFETEGPRRDYVVGSHKIWEMLFISWWALDSRVGEDKRLGRNSEDGIVFYTSLKPWDREESDMRDFRKFLEYWGWRL